MRKNFFAFSPYFRLTVPFSSLHSVISGIQKNILRQKRLWCEPPFFARRKRGVFRRFAPEHRQKPGSYFTFLWIKLERTRTAWYNTCAGCENSSAFPHTRLCTFAVATRSPHGDRNALAKCLSVAVLLVATRSPYGDRNPSLALISFMSTLVATRSPHGDRNQFCPLVKVIRSVATRSPHGDRIDRSMDFIPFIEWSQPVPLTGTETER